MNEQIAAIWLMLGFVIFVPGGLMFTARVLMKQPRAQAPTFVVVERCFVIAAVVATVLGLALLENLLRAAGELDYPRIGSMLYLLGAVMMMAAETRYIKDREWVYPQIIAYVVLACLGQAAFGIAILRSDLLADWVGWATIIWNIGCLIALPIFSRKDIYYPVIHHVAPLLIGIVLLVN